MQMDGNLVLYDHSGRDTWNSETDGEGPGCKLVCQDDGNLVIYNRKGEAIWETDTRC